MLAFLWIFSFNLDIGWRKYELFALPCSSYSFFSPFFCYTFVYFWKPPPTLCSSSFIVRFNPLTFHFIRHALWQMKKYYQQSWLYNTNLLFLFESGFTLCTPLLWCFMDQKTNKKRLCSKVYAILNWWQDICRSCGQKRRLVVHSNQTTLPSALKRDLYIVKCT